MADESNAPKTDELIGCSASDSFADWMREFGGSLVISTYQANRVALIGHDGRQVSVLMREFDKPMGLTVSDGRIALATRNEIFFFANSSLLAHDLIETEPGRYDALFLPRASFVTGDLNTHDLGAGADQVWFVNTRFSCLCQPSTEFSFVPRWKPPFISEIVPEDRCHLNGLAMNAGQPKFVTALGETDVVGGWRDNKARGGIVVDVETGEIVLRGLSMPHSPRLYDGALWVLNSGTGEFLCVDAKRGHSSVVCALPGYLRGLSFTGPYALIGMCQIRERHIFGGLPVSERFPELLCGVVVIDLRTGREIGQLRFTSGCHEIYDIGLLPGMRRPNILHREHAQAREAFTAPEFAYWLRPSSMIADHTNESTKPVDQ